MSKILYIIVPCCNEAGCLREISGRLEEKLRDLQAKKLIAKQSRVVYVDDGSTDGTWEMIKSLGEMAVGVKLSRNFGHQNAVLAGLMYAKEQADITISVDADLQDDINAIDQFVEENQRGAEVVYGVRSERDVDSKFKKWSALLFYRVMRWLGVNVMYNSADYRLLSRRALEELSQYSEVNLFLRGIVPTLGLKTAKVYYRREKRFAGESKYGLRKMLGFAWEGITSFSIKPIRLILWLGVIAATFNLFVLLALLDEPLRYGLDVVLSAIWLVGGLQLAAIGVVGEYVGKTYLETKRRPRYLIEEVKAE